MSVHRIGFRAIAHATEEIEKVGQALSFTSGSEDLVETNMEGHFGNSITVLEVCLTRNRDIKEFLTRLVDAGILSALSDEVETRLDDDCTFHFRLDKQAACIESITLASGNDFIDCSIKVAAYPAKRDVALKVLGGLFFDLIPGRVKSN